MTEKKHYEDVDSPTSNRTGVAGLLESALRRFRVAAYLAP